MKMHLVTFAHVITGNRESLNLGQGGVRDIASAFCLFMSIPHEEIQSSAIFPKDPLFRLFSSQFWNHRLLNTWHSPFLSIVCHHVPQW